MNFGRDDGGVDPWDPRRITQYGGAASGTSVAPVVAAPVAPVQTQRTLLTPGYTPDYGALIKSDPGYLQWQSNSRLDLEQASAQRREALRRLAIQYGGIAPGAKDVYGDIDQGTLELAQKNEYSDTNRLKRTYGQSIEAFKRARAARGALQSGDLGHGLHQASVMQGEREYDLGNAFANAAQGAVNNYVGTESAIRRGEYDALRAAQASVYSNPAYRPTEAEYADVDVPIAPAASTPWTEEAVGGLGYTRDPVTGQIIYGGVRRAEGF
jgi:hypothetical protein